MRIWNGEPRAAEAEEEEEEETPPCMDADGALLADEDLELPSRVRTGGASSTGVGGLAPNVLGTCPLASGWDWVCVCGCDGG